MDPPFRQTDPSVWQMEGSILDWGVRLAKWRGPFLNGPLHLPQKDPPISQNGPLHLAKRTPPFLKWTPPVQTNPSILRNVPLYFAQKGPLHFGKWTPSFCEMDPSILRNGGVHLKWRGPFRKMEGSIWRNGGVLFEMDPSILARLQLLPVRTVCKLGWKFEERICVTRDLFSWSSFSKQTHN